LKDLKNNSSKLPKLFIYTVVSICVLPFLLNLLGVDFGSKDIMLNQNEVPKMDPYLFLEAHFYQLSGAFTHTILEWTAFCAALITVIFAFVNYKNTNDITTPIIGVALFCAGCMDAFHTLAADRLIEATADNRNLIPFTWAISRVFNALIMAVGVGIFLFKKKQLSRKDKTKNEFVFILSISAVFGIVAYAIIYYCAVSEKLPETMFPDSFISRPWDVIPLVIFILAGLFLYPRFYKQNPNLFTHALLISIIPEITTELHMAFGSTSLFDNDFNIAHFLKIFAYVVPLAGLILDYSRTYSEQTYLNEVLQAEINTRESAERLNEDLRNALNQSALVSITDVSGRISFANDLFCLESQFSSEELNGQDHQIINSANHSKEFMKDLWRTITNGNIWKGEIMNKAKDGSFYWVYSTIVPFLDRKKKPYQFLSISFIITNEKESEIKLRKQNEELEHFAYLVSHDLKAPLRGIDSLANFIEIDLKNGHLDDVYLNLDTLKDRAYRMENLIEGILEFSKIGMNESLEEKVDLNQLIQEIIGDIDKPDSFKIEFKTSYPIIIGTRILLIQLFSNLITNGIKHNDKKQGMIVLDYTEHENEYEFSIEDNGPGIAQKYHEKIFVMFQVLQSSGSYESTGIGLSIVKKIIEKLNGSFRLESDKNKGAKFIVLLPKQSKLPRALE